MTIHYVWMDERRTPRDAQLLIRKIANEGTVTYAVPHALERMRERDMDMMDCENVMMRGQVAEPEWENGAWRYHVTTKHMTVVVQILGEDRLLMVTCWRNRRTR